MSGSMGLAFGRWEEPAHIVPAGELPVFMETASLKMKTGSGLKKSLAWLLKSLLSRVTV